MDRLGCTRSWNHLFSVALHPAADITDAPFHRLTVTIHRIRVDTTVYLMAIRVDIQQFPVLINDIENEATVLREFNRT